jgi:hypothetical protein
MVFVPLRGFIDAPYDLGEKLSVKIRKEEPDRIRLVRAEASSGKVRRIMQLFRNLNDTPFSFIVNQAAVIEHARHGCR